MAKLSFCIFAVLFSFSSCEFLTAQGSDAKDDAPSLEIGKPAPDFELKNLQGDDVTLSKLTGKSPIVLVVLRGFPGYQCPICTRQVGDLINRAKDLAKHDATVLLVYPGPKDDVQSKAKEFFAKAELPKSFQVLLDPDYQFTSAYGLRWDAPKETAYPSTIVLDPKGIIRFVKISKSHGDRASAKAVLQAVEDLKK
jgi:thioredoxin-dependent peroxiredoxin